MTQHGLVHKGLTSADKAEHLYAKNFEAFIKKQPNLGNANFKLNLTYMLLAGWACMLSLRGYYDLYASDARDLCLVSIDKKYRLSMYF